MMFAVQRIQMLFKPYGKVAPRVLSCACILLVGTVVLIASGQSPQNSARVSDSKRVTARPHYQIELELDVEHGSYSGSEQVRWTNRGDRGTSVIFFHLYSNLRSDQSTPAAASAPPAVSEALPAPDEPRIDIAEVKSATGEPLFFNLDDQDMTLRVNLREAVPPGKTVEVFLKFKGTVPQIDPEETGLVTHVIKQVSAAIKSEREVRRAREINFSSRNLMFLGTAFPVLVVHDGDEWRRKVEPGAGDLLFNEASDYDVTIRTSPGLAVFTSAPEVNRPAGDNSRSFAATSLRDFAIIAGSGLRSEQQVIGHLTVRAVFFPEHERIGRRVLANAVDAARVFQEKFGALPFAMVSVVEAPLVAGLGSIEFAAFDVIASAFYVDFESPAMRNMPELIREQRASVEDSLEWTVAHLFAHQWWGAVVGSDPGREPVLDEAMSGWSALLYYRQVYGEARAAVVMQDQLRGVYRLYRTFGGEDLPADRPARDYRNSFQYAAIVVTKGALMFVELQK
ncbi:MAG TPA: hypothetical protein VGN90_01820, partial [Pyrinomonadaceae bacterium]|nr:hypothetical protein [Pyrinomonadaceae bacterium]